MKMRHLGSVVLAVAFGGIVQSWSRAYAEPDPGLARRFDLAKQYLRESHRLDTITVSLTAQLDSTPNICLSEACSRGLREAYAQAVREALPAYIDAVAKVWAKNLTEKELQDALTFVESPSGRSILAIQPTVSAMQAPLTVKLQKEIRSRSMELFCVQRPVDCGARPPGSSPHVDH
jgi:hypothetical protein